MASETRQSRNNYGFVSLLLLSAKVHSNSAQCCLLHTHLLTRDEQRDPHEDPRQSLGGFGLQKDAISDVANQRIDGQRCRSVRHAAHHVRLRRGRCRPVQEVHRRCDHRMFRAHAWLPHSRTWRTSLHFAWNFGN